VLRPNLRYACERDWDDGNTGREGALEGSWVKRSKAIVVRERAFGKHEDVAPGAQRLDDARYDGAA
jgi:hypothetical protein